MQSPIFNHLPANGSVLSVRPALEFRNPLVTARSVGNNLFLSVDKGTLSFPEMLAERKPRTSESIRSELNTGNYCPANLGASIALIAEIKGIDYAVLVFRSGDSVDDGSLKLPSAYLNSHNSRYDSAKLITDTVGIFASEVLILDAKGHVVQAEIKDPFVVANLARTGLPARFLRNYQPTVLPVSLEATGTLQLNDSVHKFLPSMVEGRNLSVNGTSLPAAFQLNFDTCFNALQLIAHLRISVPPHLSICSAEVGRPNPQGLLEKRFKRDGVVLMELDRAGFPTGNFNRLIEGRLSKWDLPANCTFTEAFGRPDQLGMLTRQQIPASEYLASMKMPTLG